MQSDSRYGLVLLVTITFLTGCQTPFLVFPGKALKGEPQLANSFMMAKRHKLLKLEVNPDAPYSVILRVTIIDDQLYVDAAPTRKWAAYLRASNKVKIGLGKQVYAAIAVRVKDPRITDHFLNGREIYRLMPATSIQ